MVQFRKGEFARIKNPRKDRGARDFEFNMPAFVVMVIIVGLGIALHSVFGGTVESAAAPRAVAAVIVAAALYTIWPRWTTMLAVLLVANAVLFSAALVGAEWSPLNGLEPRPLVVAFVLAACVFGPSLQVVQHWDKVVVLRFGRFHKVHGPGPFWLLPLLDRCAAFVDTRIRVTDFSAEKILTRDTVPVHVDALAFWMIWDAQRATLEVENFLEAVTLSAQTALRDSVGKYSLTTLLTERETLYHEIQSILDAKTNPWGITILSVEFTDIVLPPDLEDVMSRQAQAEREKQARILLGEAEAAMAESFRKAGESYVGHPEALNLRALSMVHEGIKARGGLVLMPSSALESMNVGGVLGVAAAAKNGATAAGDTPATDTPPTGTIVPPAGEGT